MAWELFSNYCLNRGPLANGYYCVTMMGKEKNTISGHGNYLVIRIV